MCLISTCGRLDAPESLRSQGSGTGATTRRSGRGSESLTGAQTCHSGQNTTTPAAFLSSPAPPVGKTTSANTSTWDMCVNPKCCHENHMINFTRIVVYNYELFFYLLQAKI